MNEHEAASIVTSWRFRFDRIRAVEAEERSNRRDVKPSARDELLAYLNTRDLPLDIALGFRDAIGKASEEQLPAIERMLLERGRQWTGKPKRAPSLNRVTKRTA